ncbi:MAG TPA: hypothetical protein VKQ72_14525, partial [Aggregatilineales bacterium]|nr:hypothetical protein [Aggregatilineales bacterium]
MKRLHLSARNRVMIVVGIVLVMAVALALDLHFHGLAWNVFYLTTGEETPLGQIAGFIQYVGNVTRRQPIVNGSSSPDWTADTGGNSFGVNTFL